MVPADAQQYTRVEVTGGALIGHRGTIMRLGDDQEVDVLLDIDSQFSEHVTQWHVNSLRKVK